MGKKGQAKMVNPSRKPHCNEDVACFNKFGPGGASSSSEKANKHERALVSAPDENEEMSRKKASRLHALRKLRQHAGEGMADAAPDWVVRLLMSVEKEHAQQLEQKERDLAQLQESKESIESSYQGMLKDWEARCEQLEKGLEQEREKTRSWEESYRSIQEEVNKEREARREAEGASKAAVNECASMTDELHRLRGIQAREDAQAAFRTYNTRLRLKDTRACLKERRERCRQLEGHVSFYRRAVHCNC